MTAEENKETQTHDVEQNKPSPATESEHGHDPNEVDWDGPADPHNPRNWSAWRRGMLVGIVTCVVFSTSIASSAVAPAVPQILREFNSNNAEIGTFIVTIELLGTGVGPILMGPMSEVVGRRIIYNCANIGFSAFTIGCALTPSLAGLVVLRFLQGCAASCSLNNAGGTISDLVPIHRRGFAMSMYSVGFLLGPAVGPVAGSFLAASKGWRWVFWLLLIVNGTMGVICALTYTETYAPVILERKVKKLREKTGNQALYAKGQRQLPVRTVLRRAITRPVKMFLFCPVVTGLAVYNAVVYGFTYLLFSTFSVVFEDQYHFDQGRLGLVYLGLAIGFLVSLSIASVVNDRTHKRLSKEHGATKPEFRLVSLVYGAIAIPIGFFIYGWTVQYHVDSVVPIFATGIVGFGVMFTFIPFNVYMIDAYTKYAASAIAAGNILRSLSAALLPLVGVPLYSKLGYGWGNALLAFITLGLGAMSLLFRRYGEEWRRKFSVQFD
ncbi:major facilitator superfamily domain-containing protein [Aspergillus caelatus]|uniref:Major facilitator superfamily domain-containing protein n=1 Tax=Aspergillus caelatus TaxID=61420 RepID=A0A5N7ADX7_9EURO|nr:major facilitator superfamily domain-containing protein [Aspergillus caelatus]KAE8367279.1 major facilitator superfamily domain-containing protein [Aspergillus caelatus]